MNVLKTMRNMGSLKILLWIIVISFVAAMFTVWGTGGSTEKGGRTWLGQEYSVKVEGRTMSPAIYRLQYRFYSERIRQMLGENFREDFLRGASKTIADGQVRQLILADMAKDYSLKVSDEELAAGIQKIYNFKDPKTEYPALISRMGVTAEEFQELLRYELLSQKLTDLIGDTVVLSDAELLKRYKEQNEGVKAMVAAVPASTFMAKVEAPTEADIQARYDRDKSKYTVPEKRTIEYVFVAPGQVRNAMKLDDALIKAYYESHLADFGTPATQRRASHILVKVDEKAPAKDIEAARKKAEDLYAKIKGGADFAAVAKANSEDNSAVQGGDLGWFERNRMVKPFADAVFDTCKAVGEVVGPVQSQFGFHIIKLTGIGGQPKPFDEVKAQVRQTLLLKDQGIQDKLKAQTADAEKALKDAKDDAGVKAAAAKAGLQVTEVKNPLAKEDPIMGLGVDAGVQEAIFKAQTGVWSETLKVRDGVVRVKVTAITPSHPAKLDEVKSKIVQEIRDERAMNLARAAAQTLASGAKDAASLEAAAKKDGYPVQQSQLLKASDAIPGAGKAPEVNKALAAAKVGDVVGPLAASKTYVVAVLTEHVTADMKKFQDEKDSFARTQRDEYSQQVMDDYVQRRKVALEKEKKILYNQELLDSMEPASGRQPS
jgi:peptidyl-prolyl cis-trans isomerase D